MDINGEDIRENLDDNAQHRLKPPPKNRIGWRVFICTECFMDYVVAASRDPEKQEASTEV